MIRKIVEAPHPLLKQKSAPVENIHETTFKLAKDLIETQKANFGVGISAPQIGILKRIITISSLVLVNPEIISFSQETTLQEEGCLSLPGITGIVKRAKEIKVKGIKLDLESKSYSETTFKAKGLFARIIQHEINHLDGILFIDQVEDLTTIKKIPLPYKIIFAGTSDFSATILAELIKNGWSISLVITEPDKPAGRGKLPTPPPLKKLAEKYHLLIYQPEKISGSKSSLLNLQPDLMIVAAYGQILPKEIYGIPLHQTICLHPSLLPKYRGPSPIQTAILNGERETGVTIFQINQKIDAGKIIQQAHIKIRNDDNAQSLTKKLALLGAQVLNKTLPDFLQGKIKPKPQDEKKATWTKKSTKEDGFIKISEFKTQSPKQLTEIERKIRAYYPWPKVWTMAGGKRLIIHKAHLTSNPCALHLDIVQPAGKKPMAYEDYLKGNPKIN